MRPRRERFLAWPNRALFAQALWLALPVTGLWVLVYHGADWLTSVRTHRVRVHLDAELGIPLVPPFILAYLSLDVVFILAPFILRSRQELEALASSLGMAIVVAGACFLVLPADLAYPPSDPGRWSAPFALARALAGNYNLVPSLHVTMSCLCLAAYAPRGGVAGKALLATWAAAIALSTVLTHQHHLLDVVAGLGLALVGKRLIYDPWRASPADVRTPLANPGAGPTPPA